MSVPDEMTCKQLVELVTEYLEETLSPSERAQFEQHLQDCPYCRVYLDQMRKTICLLGKLTEDSIPIGSRQQLLEAFRGWHKG